MSHQWSSKAEVPEIKPNWLTDKQKENTFATNSGWVLRHPSGIEETLVAIANLKQRLGAASISEVRFGPGKYSAGSTRTIRVTYNEAVTVTGTPTIDVTALTTGIITATYTATEGAGNVLVFSFTLPAAPDTLSISAQSLASAVIAETSDPLTTADLTINSVIADNAGTKAVVS